MLRNEFNYHFVLFVILIDDFLDNSNHYPLPDATRRKLASRYTVKNLGPILLM